MDLIIGDDSHLIVILETSLKSRNTEKSKILLLLSIALEVDIDKLLEFRLGGGNKFDDIGKESRRISA